MITLKFVHERETKNTQRFQEVVADGAKPVVGPLYVSKEVAGEAKNLTVVITLEG